MINAYNILVRKPKGERPLGGPTRKLEDKIRLERGWEDFDWIRLAQDTD
jgi:hypothetical protein